MSAHPPEPLLDFESIFSSAPCYISVQDRDLRIIATNEVFRETFGEAVGRFCYEVYKKRQAKCLDCPVEKAFQDGKKHSSAQVFCLPGGEEKDVVAYTSPQLGEEGEVRSVIQVSVDVTPAKRLEAKLRESRELFRLLFDEAPCYISLQDRNLRIVQSNRRFKEHFGDYVGANCYEVYKHRGEPCLTCPVAETFADGKTHHSEEVVTVCTGKRVNTLVSTAPIRNAEGEIDWVMEMSTDITQIRQLQDQLTNLGLLVGSISHGMKGLLTGLDGGIYLHNTGIDKGKPERAEKGRRMIHRNAEQIRRVVLDLLNIAGEQEPRFAAANLHDLATTVVGRLRKLAGSLAVDFVVDLDEDVGTCEVDANSLTESLVNILVAAFESCRLDGRGDAHAVQFRLQSDGDNAVFTIQDNGRGLDRETRETMFSLLFTARGGKGTGLGLFTANKVIEKHRGVIEVESEPGEGTVYKIRIPRVRGGSAG